MKEIVIEEYRDLKRQLEEEEDSNKKCVIYILFKNSFLFVFFMKVKIKCNNLYYKNDN